jgi:(1->4)-alpha-D-glucan 1-alpha-D-glucosylmutase
LYRYNRLLCLNEVGASPARFGLSVEEFHAANLERSLRFPRHLLTTSTHDTKRSGDVRARLSAIAGCADEWRAHVTRWRDVNASLRQDGAPDANEEYLIYQTLVGTWPLPPERLELYLEKALREAKTNTNWIDPDLEWEQAVKGFARALYDHRPFLDDFEPFVERVAREGERVSLGHTLLKLTCPGVPDLYQGDELLRFDLVDPDNRRRVDWERRRRLLAELAAGAAPTRETAKLHLIRKTLQLRARRPESFLDGRYEPVVSGDSVCAYRRGDDVLVAVALRPGARFEPPQEIREVLGLGDMGVWLFERE